LKYSEQRSWVVRAFRHAFILSLLWILMQQYSVAQSKHVAHKCCTCNIACKNASLKRASTHLVTLNIFKCFCSKFNFLTHQRDIQVRSRRPKSSKTCKVRRIHHLGCRYSSACIRQIWMTLELNGRGLRATYTITSALAVVLWYHTRLISERLPV
jgi:hypothetical protein